MAGSRFGSRQYAKNSGIWLYTGHLSGEAIQALSCFPPGEYRCFMRHAQLVQKAVEWLRTYRCGVVLSEQACISGEMPDAIGWKRSCHSVLVECKISRGDFLADRAKGFRQQPDTGVGCERFYLTPRQLVHIDELPVGWGLLEYHNRTVKLARASARNLRTAVGFRYEMNLLLASLRRVEIRIEPQTITDFLKWKNRMAEYNRGALPQGILPAEEEMNFFLEAESSSAPENVIRPALIGENQS